MTHTERPTTTRDNKPVPGNGAGGQPAGGATTGRHRRKSDLAINALIAFFVVLLIGGLGTLAYPTVADFWNRMHQSYAVAGYIEQTDDLSAARKQELLDQAHAYNAKLAADPDRWHMSDAERREYEQTLDITGTGIMGYVTIPRIKVRLPIYHGTEDTVLQIAVGHLAGTSLPVGGTGTHAAVSGHTGLPSARLLTGLDELEVGDTFAFHVLDETYTYQVDQINVVLPSQLDDLAIDPNGDYATLITCTPYGVNSHRLLVRGHRIPNPKQPDSTDYDTPAGMLAIAIGVGAGAFALIAGAVIWFVRRRHRVPGHDGAARVHHARR